MSPACTLRDPLLACNKSSLDKIRALSSESSELWSFGDSALARERPLIAYLKKPHRAYPVKVSSTVLGRGSQMPYQLVLVHLGGSSKVMFRLHNVDDVAEDAVLRDV